MSRFMQMIINHGSFNNNKILKKKTLEMMTSQQNEHITLDNDFRMGLNFVLSHPALEYAGKVIRHDGGISPYHSDLVILKDKNIGVFVTTNSENGLGIIRQMSQKILQHAVEYKYGVCAPGKAEYIPEVVSLDKDVLTSYTGNFASLIGIISVEERRSRLVLKLDKYRFRLYPLGNDWFRGKYLLLGFIPINKDVYVKITNYKNNRYITLGQPVSGRLFAGPALGIDFKPVVVSEEWKKKYGTYKLEDGFKEKLKQGVGEFGSFKLHSKDNYLVFSGMVSGQEINAVLNPVNENEAIIMGMGRMAKETLFSKEKNGIEYFEFAGLKYYKVQD